MKRHPALAPLSRDHQHALAVAQRLRRATRSTAQQATGAFLAFWEPEGRLHFRIEEDILLPAYAAHGDPGHPTVIQVLVDHVSIRRDADRLATQASLQTLHGLGERLAAHVRLEEHQLFPLIEDTLSDADLRALATHLLEVRPCATDGSQLPPGGTDSADGGREPSCRDAATVGLADTSLAGLVERVASAKLTPGAGPTVAWTCALAAALVEMVSTVSLSKEPENPRAREQRRDRAATLRALALTLADRDLAVYQDVLAVQRRRDERGHAKGLRAALLAATDPLVAIVEAAAEVTRLAADAVAQARGGVRGEAITAAVLGEAVVQAGLPLVQLNLAGARDDPRLALVRKLAQESRADRERALGG